MAGFDHAGGEVVVTMDGDLQNDPQDIPELAARLGDDYDVVCGWRRGRKDGFILRKIPSWCANRLIQLITGIPIRDNGCSLKAYRRDVLNRLVLYSDQHRFIPALAASCGARIAEAPVRHHARRFGRSKYGLSRTLKVLADLMALKLVTTFRVRPLAFFALATSATVIVSLVFAASWMLAIALFSPAKAAALIFPGATFLWFGTGLYLLMLGLIAEVAVRTDFDRSGDAPATREI